MGTFTTKNNCCICTGTTVARTTMPYRNVLALVVSSARREEGKPTWLSWLCKTAEGVPVPLSSRVRLPGESPWRFHSIKSFNHAPARRRQGNCISACPKRGGRRRVATVRPEAFLPRVSIEVLNDKGPHTVSMQPYGLQQLRTSLPLLPQCRQHRAGWRSMRPLHPGPWLTHCSGLSSAGHCISARALDDKLAAVPVQVRRVSCKDGLHAR